MSFIYLVKNETSPQASEIGLTASIAGFETLWNDETRQLSIRRDASTGIFDSPDRLVVTDGEYISDLVQELLSFNWHDVNSLVSRIRGNAVVISKNTPKSIVLTDTLGSFPLFYGTSTGDKLRVYSPLFHAVRSTTGQQPDFSGIYQYLGGGYTIGNRTLDTAVKQFLPGEIHFLETAVGPQEISRTISPNPWASVKRVTLGPNQIEEAMDALRHEGTRLERSQLMFSAGWDSRTILAGILSQGLQETILAYSHGDTSSRELKIASSICMDHGVRYVAKELETLEIDVDIMEEALQYSGQALFPQWRIASEFATQQGYHSLTGGIFGGVLGGHYSVPSIAKGSRAQFTSLMKYLYFPITNGPSAETTVDIAYRLLHRSGFIRWWCLKDAISDEIQESVSRSCAEDTRVELRRLKDAGIEDLEGLVEAFQVGQRGRQYMNGQIGICRSKVPVINPFTNEVLVSLACGLPYREKVHNQVNRVLLRTMAPKLLSYPMAATLLPASAPIGLQELSRGARKLVEEGRWKLHQFNRGTSRHRPNMGWVNFEFLRKKHFLEDLIDSLNGDFWDKARMHGVVANYPATSMHPIFDMLCKIKTIDYRLRP